MQRFRLLHFTFFLPLAACSTPGSNHQQIETRSYDVRDLVEREPMEFGINAVLGKRSSAGGDGHVDTQPEFVHRLIKREVDPSTGTWNAGPEALDMRDGSLTVRTTPAVHQGVEDWLAYWRQWFARPRTEPWTGPAPLSEQFEYRVGP